MYFQEKAFFFTAFLLLSNSLAQPLQGAFVLINQGSVIEDNSFNQAQKEGLLSAANKVNSFVPYYNQMCDLSNEALCKSGLEEFIIERNITHLFLGSFLVCYPLNIILYIYIFLCYSFVSTPFFSFSYKDTIFFIFFFCEYKGIV